MRRTLLLSLGATLLLVASEAPAAITTVVEAADAGRAQRLHSAAASGLKPPKASPPELFSKSVLDPAHCNYQYVDYEGRMVVRSELKLTCTVKQ